MFSENPQGRQSPTQLPICGWLPVALLVVTVKGNTLNIHCSGILYDQDTLLEIKTKLKIASPIKGRVKLVELYMLTSYGLK
jgi:hypothetical protein